MRDLQYLRETLAPIAEHAIGWEAFTSLHFLVDQAENREFDEWQEAIQQPVDQVGKTAERLRRDRRVLVVLLGPEVEVPKWLGELASDGDALIHIARKTRGSQTDYARDQAGSRWPLGEIWVRSIAIP